MRTLLTALSIFLFSFSASAAALPDAPHIVVNGSAEASIRPDTLTLSLQVIEVDESAQDARDDVEKRSKTLIKTVKKMGVDKKDIQAAALQVSPRYNWKENKQIYTGTEVTRNIQITLRDLNKYDRLLKAVLRSETVRITDSRLSSSKEKELRTKSLQKAVADAQSQAELLVTGLPQKVGAVYAINTNARPMHPAPVMYKMADSANNKAAFEPGTISFSQSVQVVFYLQNR